jgi:hypothetical protein
VIGYGEITTVVAWPTPHGSAAVKRLPPFDTIGRLDAYRQVFHDYLEGLAKAGVMVVPTRLDHLPDHRGYSAYVIQPLLDRDQLAHNLLRDDGSDATDLLDRIAALVAEVNGAGIGFDAQMSNWGWADGELVYFDVSTPLLRHPDGRDRLDTDIFLASLPWPLRAPVKRWLVRSIIDEYFDRRVVLLNLAANLIKERLAHRLPLVLDRFNRQLDEPLTESEVRRYYRKDAITWSFLQRLRRIDRAWQRRVRRRPYPFLLPERIER